MHEGGRDRPEHGERRALEPPAHAGKVDQQHRQHHREGLHEDVPAAHVRGLVGEHAFEARPAAARRGPVDTATAEPFGPRPQAGPADTRPGSGRASAAGSRASPTVHRRSIAGSDPPRARTRERRAFRAEPGRRMHRPRARRGARRRRRSTRSGAAERPPTAPKPAATISVSSHAFARLRAAASRSIRSGVVVAEAVAVVLAQAARPVRLSQRLEQWSEATFCSGTRMWPFSSMWGTSSIERYNALLVLAPEERDLDLLTLVLVRVVLDGLQASRFGLFKRPYPPSLPPNVVPVRSRCGPGMSPVEATSWRNPPPG